MSSFEDMTKTFDCQQGELLQSSKDAGITCGDLAITLKNGGAETTLKTCFIFPYELLSKVKIPDMFKDQLNEMFKENPDLSLNATQFTFELSDSKGNKIKYDSETGEITHKTGKSIMLNISKYLFLLSLFLL